MGRGAYCSIQRLTTQAASKSLLIERHAQVSNASVSFLGGKVFGGFSQSLQKNSGILPEASSHIISD
jgi:hypothetical protein